MLPNWNSHNAFTAVDSNSPHEKPDKRCHRYSNTRSIVPLDTTSSPVCDRVISLPWRFHFSDHSSRTEAMTSSSTILPVQWILHPSLLSFPSSPNQHYLHPSFAFPFPFPRASLSIAYAPPPRPPTLLPRLAGSGPAPKPTVASPPGIPVFASTPRRRVRKRGRIRRGISEISGGGGPKIRRAISWMTPSRFPSPWPTLIPHRSRPRRSIGVSGVTLRSRYVCLSAFW